MKRQARFLVPVWGARYIRLFAQLALPSYLARGNLPALAELTDLEIIILTCSTDHQIFEQEPAFQRLRQVAPVRFISIDDLVAGGYYGITLTLAYLRGVADAGDQMVDIHFVFMNADLILADGSLRGLAKHILDDRHVVLACSIRATSEELEEPLRNAVSQEDNVLAIPPRQLVSMAMKSLHPTQIAKIVNSDLCHSIHVNQLYWQVDENTLISRHFLMFMLCVKPERVVREVHAFCDYSFVPEMCPSGDTVAMEDSDDFFFLEMQARESESDFLRIGRPSLDEVASSLSRWTTQHHRENAQRHTLVFHGAQLPRNTSAVLREAELYVRAIQERLATEPQPFRDHPYWTGSYALWMAKRDSLQAARGDSAIVSAAELPSPRKSVSAMVLRAMRRLILGDVPCVPRWHPDWLDYRHVAQLLKLHLARPDKNIIYINDDSGVLESCIGQARIKPMEAILAGEVSFGNEDGTEVTLVLIEPRAEQIKLIRRAIEEIQDHLTSAADIVVFYKERSYGGRPNGLEEEITHQIGYIAPLALNKAHVIFAGGKWKRKIRNMFDRGVNIYSSHGVMGAPAMAIMLIGVMLLSLVNNTLQMAKQDKRMSTSECSSFLMWLSR